MPLPSPVTSSMAAAPKKSRKNLYHHEKEQSPFSLGGSHQATNQQVTYFCWTSSYISPPCNSQIQAWTHRRGQNIVQSKRKRWVYRSFQLYVCWIEWPCNYCLEYPSTKISFFMVIQTHNELITYHSLESPDKTITAPRSNKRKPKWADATQAKKVLTLQFSMKVSASKVPSTSDAKTELYMPKSDFAKTEWEDWNTLCTAPTTKQCLPKNTSQRYKSVTDLFVCPPWQQEEFKVLTQRAI